MKTDLTFLEKYLVKDIITYIILPFIPYKCKQCFIHGMNVITKNGYIIPGEDNKLCSKCLFPYYMEGYDITSPIGIIYSKGYIDNFDVLYQYNRMHKEDLDNVIIFCNNRPKKNIRNLNNYNKYYDNVIKKRILSKKYRHIVHKSDRELILEKEIEELRRKNDHYITIIQGEII